MTLKLELPPDLSVRLAEVAELYGITPEEQAVRLLEQHVQLTKQERVERMREYFERLHAEGDDEGDCSWDEILQRMDESRGDQRKLFPPEMKGITW